MGDWGSYTLADFLMFSPRTYARLVESYLRALWPAQVLVVAASVAVLFAHRSGRPHLRSSPLLLLAAGWAWIAWGFFWQRYADIHLAGRHLSVACAVQALLLAAAALRPGTGDTRPRPAGLLLAAAAIAGYPLATFATLGRAEVAGLMPEATALATLGFVLAGCASPRRLALLGAIPLALLAFGWSTLWTLAQAGSGG